jgi:putative NADH-flavin reductase
METKILITENKERAELHIKEIESRAKKMTDLIRYYNRVPLLKKLETKKDVFNFLKEPIKYLDSAIIKDTGVSFSDKASPAPDQVAKIFNIPYDEITDKIYKAQIGQLGNFEFDEKRTVIYLTEEAREHIAEQFKEYTQHDDEVKAFLLMQKTCAILNEYADRFNLDRIDRNQIAQRAGLKVNFETFEPNINVFKEWVRKLRLKE